MSTENNEITIEELRYQGLLERISTLTAKYENEVNDLRVSLTVTAQRLEEAQRELAELKDTSDVEETQDPENTSN